MYDFDKVIERKGTNSVKYDGEKMQEEINDLKMLLLAYKKGLIKEK